MHEICLAKLKGKNPKYLKKKRKIEALTQITSGAGNELIINQTNKFFSIWKRK